MIKMRKYLEKTYEKNLDYHQQRRFQRRRSQRVQFQERKFQEEKLQTTKVLHKVEGFEEEDL